MARTARKHYQRPALSLAEAQALSNIEAEYGAAQEILKVSSSAVNKVRGRIIEQAGKHAKILSKPVLRHFLDKVSFDASKLGAPLIPGDSIARACDRGSLGTPGVVPDTYRHLKAHVEAAFQAAYVLRTSV